MNFKDKIKMKELSIVIPVYKEKKNLDKLSDLLIKNVPLKKFEVIYVDDNSNDGSLEVLKKVKKKSRKIKFFIRKAKPRDLSKSCFYGFLKSKYQNILVMDGDLQHDPKDIKKLINTFKKKNADIVVGSRNFFNLKEKSLGFIRLNTSKLLILVVKILLGKKTKDPMSGFFLFKKELLKKTKKMSKVGYKILLDLIYSLDKKVKVYDVDINFKKRKKGNSKMDLKILIILIFDILIKFIRNFR